MVPGSHKAELPFDWKKPEHHGIADRFGVPWPAEADEPDSGVWESYGCPAGSIVVFSEAVRHTGAKWTLQSHARNAILLADNHSTTVFHEPKECMNAAVVAALSPRAASTSGREPLEWRSGDQCPRIVFFSNIERFTSLGTCQRLRSGLSLGLVIALPIELLLIPLDDFLRRECS